MDSSFPKSFFINGQSTGAPMVQVPPWQIRPKNQGLLTIVVSLVIIPYFSDLFLMGVQIHHGGPGWPNMNSSGKYETKKHIFRVIQPLTELYPRSGVGSWGIIPLGKSFFFHQPPFIYAIYLGHKFKGTTCPILGGLTNFAMVINHVIQVLGWSILQGGHRPPTSAARSKNCQVALSSKLIGSGTKKSIEPRKKPSYFPLYWLGNRDPDDGLS